MGTHAAPWAQKKSRRFFMVRPWREGPAEVPPVQADAEVIGAPATEDLPFLGRTFESVLSLGAILAPYRDLHLMH